ncbi:DUF4239 domain-containing protein [Rickettsia endosymbiont of Halotydeus destructor]|uniref:bestrophin-like domain n=1 Tax=Rickettsia endosymbiont of Halotydeus destructor TaxID=2996754 RepID=UPI003BAFCD55
MSFCIICFSFIKYIIPNHFQKEELGSLGGFLSGVVGSMYAVSTGFVLIYLLGNFNKAQDMVASEAIILMRLADIVNWLPPSVESDIIKADIFIALEEYTDSIIKDEWDIMKNGDRVSNEALYYLKHILKRMNFYKANDPTQLFIKQKIFNDIQELHTVRYNRIKMSYFSLNVQYWVIIFIMTAINLMFVCMLGTKLYLHKISVMLVCITSASMIFLLFILDKPFRGEFAVNQIDLQNAVSYIKQLNRY